MENKLWFVKMEVGFCGMDGTCVIEMPADATEQEVQEEAWQCALDHAESYGYYPYPDEEVDEDEDGDQYSDNIEGYAVPYVPEKHDMYRGGGGSFLDEFPEYKEFYGVK